jgi:predicted amidohydrolase YtcJ
MVAHDSNVRTATTHFVNATVVTMDPDNPLARSIAIQNGKIVHCGQEPVAAQAGDERIDLEGRTVLPGLIDGHVHPVGAGLRMRRCDVGDLTSVQQYLDRLAAYASQTPLPWIQASGWATAVAANERLTASALDAAVGHRPAYIANVDAHSAWVNSAALAAAGIDSMTPDPSRGVIERWPDGSPSGVLHESAMDLVLRVMPATTLDDKLDGLLAAQAHMHSLGVVGWQDALLGQACGMDDPTDAYVAAEAAGRLTARVTGALWWDRERGLEQISELCEKRRQIGRRRFSTPAVKIMLDGVPEAGTSSMLAPYSSPCGHPLGHNGPTYLPADDLRRIVVQLDGRGFDLHFHALGDRSVRDALDAIEHARNTNSSRGTRHQIAHVFALAPEDIRRFRALDVSINLQMLWTAEEMLAPMAPIFGEQRFRSLSALREWNDTGLRWAAGSDWPVSSADPFLGMHAAVLRRIEPGRSAMADQGLSPSTVLTAYTRGAAYTSRLDGNGLLAPGANADFVVVDDDPLEVSAQLQRIRVEATYIDGRAVYRR